jgi:hypothetical protein
MTFDVCVTDDLLATRADVLGRSCALAGGDEVGDGLYSFATEADAKLFTAAARFFLPSAEVEMLDLYEALAVELTPLGTFVAEEIKRRGRPEGGT